MKTLSDLGSRGKDETNISCYKTHYLYGLDK